MAEYAIQIRATIKAQNFESAQKKTERLKAKLASVAETAEVHLVSDTAGLKYPPG